MKQLLIPILRVLSNLRRNSKATNLRLLRQRGETLDTITIREVTASDIPALAALHVKTWADTYRTVKKPPTYQIREWQWLEAFQKKDGSWFCYVVQNKEGQLLGFAKGKTYDHPDLPGYAGELNKIYLLFEYHRLGIGSRLLGYLVRHFLGMGISNMVLFSEAENPTGWFYEAMGAKRLYSANGEFHGGYAWDDLQKTAAALPVE